MRAMMILFILFFVAEVEQPETITSKEPSAMEIASALKSKQKQSNASVSYLLILKPSFDIEMNRG